MVAGSANKYLHFTGSVTHNMSGTFSLCNGVWSLEQKRATTGSMSVGCFTHTMQPSSDLPQCKGGPAVILTTVSDGVYYTRYKVIIVYEPGI